MSALANDTNVQFQTPYADRAAQEKLGLFREHRG